MDEHMMHMTPGCRPQRTTCLVESDAMPSALVFAYLVGYEYARHLPTGEIAGLLPMIYTTALCVGIDEDGTYRTRYCYERALSARLALAGWDGQGDPPGPWIVQKPEGRMGPGAVR